MNIFKFNAILFMGVSVILLACSSRESEKNQLNVEDYADIFYNQQSIFQNIADELFESEKEGRITYKGGAAYFDELPFGEVFSEKTDNDLYDNLLEIFELGIISDIKCNDDSIEFGIIYSDSTVTFEYHYSKDVKLTAHIVKILDDDEYWSLVFIPHV